MGSILYYAWVVDMTVLMALSMIAINQTKATNKTMAKCTQLLDYLAYHADVKVCFYASNMIMNIYSDASYLPKGATRSQTCRHFFMGWITLPSIRGSSTRFVKFSNGPNTISE
jgi:hypothetical protein